MTENSLINLGELAKPATVLIERVSDAIGGVAKPWQIRRVAAAKADAAKTKALADLEITALEERALRRMMAEQAKDQENIEQITAKAIPHIKEDAKPEDVDDDFIRFLFERARIVSDADMQTVWGKILAGEANSTGSFSKRTIEIVSFMTKDDAELFTGFCANVWQIWGLTPVVAPFNPVRDGDRKRHHKTFDDLTHLEDIGLISFNTSGGYQRQGLPDEFDINYFGVPVHICIPGGREKNNLSFQNVILTKAGAELTAISGAKPSTDHFMEVLNYWQGQNIRISTKLSWKSRHAELWGLQ